MNKMNEQIFNDMIDHINCLDRESKLELGKEIIEMIINQVSRSTAESVGLLEEVKMNILIDSTKKEKMCVTHYQKIDLKMIPKN